MSRWTAVGTNLAVRERVKGWTANKSVKQAQQHKVSTKGIEDGVEAEDKAARVDVPTAKEATKAAGGGGFFSKLLGKNKDTGEKAKSAATKSEKRHEQRIAIKAALTEATGLLPKKHTDLSLFKKQVMPKLAARGKLKKSAAELFNLHDKDEDGVLSATELKKAQAMSRDGEA